MQVSKALVTGSVNLAGVAVDFDRVRAAKARRLLAAVNHTTEFVTIDAQQPGIFGGRIVPRLPAPHVSDLLRLVAVRSYAIWPER
jgi:hypothetical protein